MSGWLPPHTCRSPSTNARPSRQRGAVAIVVAVVIAALLGVFGLAIDGGRLYVSKAELQSAADACALAAAHELTCQKDPVTMPSCPAYFLEAAEAAGRLAGGRNAAPMQAGPVAIAAADVRFHTSVSPRENFLARSAGADPNSRFAMCIARATGITPWVMGMFGAGSSSVDAVAVARMVPSKAFCSAAPIGLCRKPGGAPPDFGYTVGQWVKSDFESTGNGRAGGTRLFDAVTYTSGELQWVDYTPGSFTESEVRLQLYAKARTCDLRIGQWIDVANVDAVDRGERLGVKSAYNTRFGVYWLMSLNEDWVLGPPDRSGYAYPNKSPGSPVISVGTSAYADFVRRRGLSDSSIQFANGEFALGSALTAAAVQPSTGDQLAYATDARLVPVPFVDCTASTSKIHGMACILLLNPMSTTSTGSVYAEYRGNAADPNSPCRSVGLVGGPGSGGPLVPTLMQ